MTAVGVRRGKAALSRSDVDAALKRITVARLRLEKLGKQVRVVSIYEGRVRWVFHLSCADTQPARDAELQHYNSCARQATSVRFVAFNLFMMLRI
jgi:hypothetical protein